jgi:hypothetical protein
MNKLKPLKGKLPFLNIPDKPIVATTQNFVPVADIIDDLVLHKDGSAAIVLESTSLNFGLLSEKEQEAVIAAYAALLNSLSFSIQIVIRSQRKDISSYLKYFDEESKKSVNPKLNFLIDNYRKFINETIKKKNVLGKSFYIVIPFSAYELGATKSAQSLTKRKGPLPFPKSFVIKKAKIALYPKRDHLIRQAGRLGLKLRQLTTPQLVNLYYALYNSEPPVSKQERENQPDSEKSILTP